MLFRFVTAENLKAALMKLPADQAKFWMELCETLVKSGLTEFSEIGHGRNKKHGTLELAPEIAAQLKQHVDGGGALETWFEYAGLGEMSAYNLAAFEKEK